MDRIRLSLLQAACLALFFGYTTAVRAECFLPNDYALLVSPESPVAGDEITVLVASDSGFEGANPNLVGPSGEAKLSSVETGLGPPPWTAVRFQAPDVGEYHLLLGGSTEEPCVVVTVAKRRRRRQAPRGIWTTARRWNAHYEWLYRAWLEHLFDVPEGSSWLPLHNLTRQFGRNLLHDHLKLGEDDTGRKALRMDPDCADNPYYLRAYFSWKIGLPFGFHHCTRGRAGVDPVCDRFTSNESAPAKGNGVSRFYRFLRQLKSAVHASSARTALEDKTTDLYPVPLTAAALVPGTVFADPYGHTLMLVRRIPQTDDQPGILLAADAQPDGTVAVKRFWQGNFLFDTVDVIGGPGFKAFRPVARRGKELHVRSNRRLKKTGFHIPLSLQQHNMDRRAFYDAMEVVVNPDPLEPTAAFRLVYGALLEQVKNRVQSVQIFYDLKHKARVNMPGGRRIFQTSGPWESYSTPSRDMRLLIAMDVINDFSNRVRRMPESFRIPKGKTPQQVADEIENLLDQWGASDEITYVRSDGSKQKLTIAQVMGRAQALEVAYNPNDCVEVRWGAPEGFPEHSTCKTRSPRVQQRKMQKYRPWFKERRRPSR
jgi:hypothetical protein